jgi:virginiamycin B lyase
MMIVALPSSAGAPAERTASMSGTVVDGSGKHLPGASVQACFPEGSICVTTYSDAQGAYRLDDLWAGSYDVRAWHAMSGRSAESSVRLRGSRAASRDFRLDGGPARVTKSDPDYLADLPAGPGKDLVRAVCIQCHGMTEKFFLTTKSRAQWEQSVDSMLAKIAPLPEGQRDTIVDYLAEHFGPDDLAQLRHEREPTPARASVATNATFVEYRMPPRSGGGYDPTTGTTLTTHDVRIDRRGNLWISEMARDALVKLDPRTGEFREYTIPYESSGPHGIIIDAADDVWITLIWADRLMKFDQARNAFTVDVKIPDPVSWPHTIVTDSRGNLWFTEMYGNAIGKFDPAAGEFSRVHVPTPRATPYGIAVDGRDNVWFTGITYHKIGRIDARTGQVTEYATPTPLSATRKLAVDREGNVWCTEFGVGKLARLDPATGTIREYALPSEYSSPYDVTVGVDGRIWFPDFNGNAVIAFDPKTEQFAEYPIPTPLSRPRIIDPDPSGGVWFSESEVGKVARLIVH